MKSNVGGLLKRHSQEALQRAAYVPLEQSEPAKGSSAPGGVSPSQDKALGKAVIVLHQNNFYAENLGVLYEQELDFGDCVTALVGYRMGYGFTLSVPVRGQIPQHNAAVGILIPIHLFEPIGDTRDIIIAGWFESGLMALGPKDWLHLDFQHPLILKTNPLEA